MPVSSRFSAECLGVVLICGRGLCIEGGWQRRVCKERGDEIVTFLGLLWGYLMHARDGGESWWEFLMRSLVTLLRVCAVKLPWQAAALHRLSLMWSKNGLFSFYSGGAFNTLRPRQNGRYFPDNTSKCTFLIENVWVSFKISLKFVPKVRNNNIPVLVQIMAWRRSGDKPLSEPMMIILLTHICITGPKWVNETKMTWNAWHLRWKMTWGVAY